MGLLSLSSSLVPPRPTTYQPCSFNVPLRPSSSQFKLHHHGGHQLASLPLPSSPLLLHSVRTSHVSAAVPKDEGAVAMMSLEELMEKDWSFLEPNGVDSKEEHDTKTKQVLSAGKIGDESRVLVSIGSDDFVDRLVESSPYEFLLIVHESLLQLAMIVEKYDEVKCWKGELTLVPEKWAPFDVVFLYCLPALPFKLDEVFSSLAKRCSPGARIVISHLQGRQGLVQQKQQFSDIIVLDLPDKMTLEKAASDHSFLVAEFRDEPSFYLAVLELRVPSS